MKIWFYLSVFGTGFFAALAVFLAYGWGYLGKRIGKPETLKFKENTETSATEILVQKTEILKTEKLE